MTATDELRRMLDERGVEYTETIVTEGVLFTIVTSKEHYFILMRDNDAGIEMWSQYLTPEQAIAATLGAVTCRRVRGHRSYRTQGGYRIECSECGYGLADRRYRYCPNCGRRIVEVSE